MVGNKSAQPIQSAGAKLVNVASKYFSMNYCYTRQYPTQLYRCPNGMVLYFQLTVSQEQNYYGRICIYFILTDCFAKRKQQFLIAVLVRVLQRNNIDRVYSHDYEVLESPKSSESSSRLKTQRRVLVQLKSKSYEAENPDLLATQLQDQTAWTGSLISG